MLIIHQPGPGSPAHAQLAACAPWASHWPICPPQLSVCQEIARAARDEQVTGLRGSRLLSEKHLASK